MEIPPHWRLKDQRYRLVGERCGCGAKLFPPRDVCPVCQVPARTPYTFSGRGEIYSFTRVQEALAGYEEYAPYSVAWSGWKKDRWSRPSSLTLSVSRPSAYRSRWWPGQMTHLWPCPKLDFHAHAHAQPGGRCI